ncbi:hypothetical protein RMATCC62417_15617 [Rhizopus microsporus]|nr:hypothetical protein RMATCC62417_15617 [Rhizopus microsporus]
MSTASLKEKYYAYASPPYCRLEAKPFFDTLTSKEKHYAHFISRASFEGTRVVITQTNPKALSIYDMIIKAFTNDQGDMINPQELRAASGVNDETFDEFLQYSAQFLGNLSNYKSFGDEKFIPRLDCADFEKIIKATNNKQAIALFERSRGEIYDIEPISRNLLGYPDDGHISGYYSDNITKEDIKLVQHFCEKNKIYSYNTRLFKVDDGYELRVAAAEDAQNKTYTLDNGQKLHVRYGDFKEQMSKIAKAIQDAIPYAANDTQTKMLKHYHDSFRTGSIEAHMDSQREWLNDVGPVVESNIGFIETYRDPHGVRAEWEGFVAMVNKEQTKQFDNLIANRSLFISSLPWPTEFERDTLNKPDFTSLEVLSFATAGIPAGINIPNYSNITQVYGSKNVSLGNVISAQAPNEQYPFVRQEDIETYRKYLTRSFQVQVVTHELGHGTGKLFSENEEGKFNFDRQSVVHPFTKGPVETWYKPGQDFNSLFKSIAASYEECRAESIALSVSPNPDILKFFNYEGQEADDVLYTMYLNMARAGLVALEFYNPDAKKWNQAHMQARYAIMNVMLKAGQDFLKLKPCVVDDLFFIGKNYEF